MQRAMDATIAAYKAAFTTMREGMTQGELSENIAAAFRALGFDGSATVQVGREPTGVAFDGTHVWVANKAGTGVMNTVSRQDRCKTCLQYSGSNSCVAKLACCA